jgi:hypothetical protein
MCRTPDITLLQIQERLIPILVACVSLLRRIISLLRPINSLLRQRNFLVIFTIATCLNFLEAFEILGVLTVTPGRKHSIFPVFSHSSGKNRETGWNSTAVKFERIVALRPRAQAGSFNPPVDSIRSDTALNLQHPFLHFQERSRAPYLQHST